MTEIVEARSAANTASVRPKQRRFWLFDFLASPFTDTDHRAHHKIAARRAHRRGIAAAEAKPVLKDDPRGKI
jgi:hypothetical protein